MCAFKEYSKSEIGTLEVSIIVPIYNMESLLPQCLVSIREQIFENYELILVDDGSQDNSLIIAKEYAAKDTRAKVFSQVNSGVSIARNKGLEIAQGKWVMFVDPDDFLDPTILQVLLDAVGETTDIIACCCNALIQRGECKDHFFDSSKTFRSIEEKKELYKQLLVPSYGQPGRAYTAIGVPWGKLYRRNFLEEHHFRFNPQLRRFQDNIFNIYVFYSAREIQYVDVGLYNYRVEHLHQYYQRYSEDFIATMCIACEERYKSLNDINLLSDIEIYGFYKNECLRQIIRILRNGVFHPENKSSMSSQKQQIDEILNLECFRDVFLNGNRKDFQKNEYRVVFSLLQNHRYSLCRVFITGRRTAKQLIENIKYSRRKN